MPVDHEVIDAELAQARAEPDAALAATDDEDVGIAVDAEALDLGGARLLPRHAVVEGAMPYALGPVQALVLLEPLELVQGGQQGPRALVIQAQEAGAAPDRRLESDPRRDNASGFIGLLAVGDS